MVVSNLVLILIATLVSGNYGWSALPFSIANLALLAISYRWVSRLPRVLLKLMWQYSLVVGVVAIIFNVIQAGMYGAFYAKSSVTTFAIYIALLGLVQAVVGLAILVGFARQASGEGFHKALALIGIAASTGANTFNVFFSGIWFLPDFNIAYFVLLLAVIPLTLVPVWALNRVDSKEFMQRRSIVVLFVVAWLSVLLAFQMYADMSWGYWLTSAVVLTVPHVALYTLMIGVTYLVRKRNSNKKPPDDPIERGSLLYGGSWRERT